MVEDNKRHASVAFFRSENFLFYVVVRLISSHLIAHRFSSLLESWCSKAVRLMVVRTKLRPSWDQSGKKVDLHSHRPLRFPYWHFIWTKPCILFHFISLRIAQTHLWNKLLCWGTSIFIETFHFFTLDWGQWWQTDDRKSTAFTARDNQNNLITSFYRDLKGLLFLFSNSVMSVFHVTDFTPLA